MSEVLGSTHYKTKIHGLEREFNMLSAYFAGRGSRFYLWHHMLYHVLSGANPEQRAGSGP